MCVSGRIHTKHLNSGYFSGVKTQGGVGMTLILNYTFLVYSEHILL